MKPTIETTHRITIKGQTFDLSTKELEELHVAISAAIGKRTDEIVEQLKRLFEQQRQNQKQPYHATNPFVATPKYWGNDKLPYEIPPLMCCASSATNEGRQDVTTDGSQQYVGSSYTAP